MRFAAQDAFHVEDSMGRNLIPREQQLVLLAIEEFVRAIEGAYVGESTPTACERLIGALFIHTMEFAVTTRVFDSKLVTLEESQD